MGVVKEVGMNYRGMYSYIESTRKFCLIDFDNGERLVGYYECGSFIEGDGQICDHKTEAKNHPYVGHNVINGATDEEAIKFFMDLCEVIFGKDSYVDIVGG